MPKPISAVTQERFCKSQWAVVLLRDSRPALETAENQQTVPCLEGLETCSHLPPTAVAHTHHGSHRFQQHFSARLCASTVTGTTAGHCSLASIDGKGCTHA
nr:hypothetical protein CFP56_64865 [Quercus suber]